MLNLDGLRFLPPHDPLRTFACDAENAHRAMADGQWRVVHGASPGLDLESLMSWHSAAAPA